jgi:cytochrome b561
MSYDKATIRFHWITAALVAALWLLGQTADWFPRGPSRGAAWSTHFTLGFLLIAVYAGRVVWRFTGGKKLPGLGTGAMRALAAAGHGVLYLMIAAVLALGIANLYAHGSHVWGLFAFPRMEESPLRHNIGEAHEWAANLLLLLAAGHAAVALVHQYVWRDGALARMIPRLAR